MYNNLFEYLELCVKIKSNANPDNNREDWSKWYLLRKKHSNDMKSCDCYCNGYYCPYKIGCLFGNDINGIEVEWLKKAMFRRLNNKFTDEDNYLISKYFAEKKDICVKLVDISKKWYLFGKTEAIPVVPQQIGGTRSSNLFMNEEMLKKVLVDSGTQCSADRKLTGLERVIAEAFMKIAEIKKKDNGSSEPINSERTNKRRKY